jgi:putative membrane-bound dehydrogenase-like protein
MPYPRSPRPIPTRSRPRGSCKSPRASCTWLAALLLAAAAGAASAGDAPRLDVLFLGDKGHHEPEKRFSWLEATLMQAGIHATYTENLGDLTAANLGKYDALMVYANIDKVSPEQEQAILDYVESGHGFVPIHCASACFGNSKALVALIGARFKTHKTAVFAPVIIDHDHPIMKGFAGYEGWDETYVHSDHNEQGRTVLAVRDENGVKEPWTWVRTQGKGRVFYTASGHDERIWQNAAYRELLVRGTAWAAGPKGEAILAAVSGAAPGGDQRPPLVYEPRPTVQNYEKRTPAPQYQLPLSPADSMRYTRTEAGFELQLFASEPDIVKPIAFTWDHRGRLYVLESVDYPSTFTEQWQGHDRIIICEDTKGTGKADKFTVFAEGLNIATGLTFANGGVLVTQAPNILFLKDTDGDDKADVKEVVMTGWSKGDTHAGPSNLHYGFDNLIYGCVGYSGFSGEVGGAKLAFRMGPFRFTRACDRMEFLGQYNNNTWGMAFNEAGELFGSTANNAHHFYTPIPIPAFKGVKGMEGNEKLYQSVKMDAHYAAHPLTDKIRQVDVFGGFTAAAGQNLYTARAFPEKYWNRCALVNEPTMHLLHQGFLKRDGSGWTEDGDGLNLLASEEQWVAPVHAEVGPDGAVWVADWYNFIIQHNPTPSRDHGGFDTKTGAGGAHVNPLRDHEHGRIYRIVAKAAKPAPALRLDPADAAQLVATLKNDNLFWRLTAQRLLVERGKTDVVPALVAACADQAVDAVGINGGVIHALWTLHGLKALDGSNAPALAAAVAALRHPAPSVRRNAAQVLPPTPESAKALLASGILADQDLNVRLAAFLAAAAMPASDELGAALFAQSQRSEVIADRYLPTALRIAAARHSAGFLAAELASAVKLPVVGGDGAPENAANLLANPGFEDGQIDQPTAWTRTTYGGEAQFRIVADGRTGRCAEISSDAGGDVGWMIKQPVKPRTAYRLTGWVKTKDIKGAAGALFNLNGNPARSPAQTGTKGWTRLTMDFDSEDRTSVEINCLFGGWGKSTGTAWYDDLALVELGASNANAGGAPGETERLVARNASGLPLPAQDALLARLGTADAGLAAAIIDGLAAGWSEPAAGNAPGTPGAAEKTVLVALAGKLAPANQRRLGALAEIWHLREGLPGLAGAAPEQPVAKKDPVKPLPPEQQKRFDSGKSRYLTLCIACHQPNGMGLPAVAPPLVGSSWVTGPEGHLARIVLNGVKGPIEAAGTKFALEMPPLKEVLDDVAIAEILTYVRHEWGNDAPPVETNTIKALRKAEAERSKPWTAEELLKVP